MYYGEILVSGSLILLAIVAAQFFHRSWFRNLERAFFQLGRRRRTSIAIVFLAAIAVRVALLAWVPVPQPMVHDEFSYLLAGDTFALGRMSNPPHPLWQHFETMHVLQQPTYMSKYPPGQGIALAVGNFLGNPWIGVLLSCAGMAAAICWMLQAWMPPAWALLGGILVIIRLGTLSYFVNSYWGGAVAAIGGALVFGALPRLLRRPSATNALLLALGVAILANSRPYEGLALCVGAAIVAMLWPQREKRSLLFAARTWIPVTIGLLFASMVSAFYFYRVTGSPFTFPYSVYWTRYEIVPLFPWQSLNALPAYNHESIRHLFLWAYGEYRSERVGASGPVFAFARASVYWRFYVGPLLTVPVVLMLAPIFRDRRFRLLLVAGTIFLVALELESWRNLHYAAPATALAYAVVLQCMRHLRLWPSRKSSFGPLVISAVVAASLGMFAFLAPYRYGVVNCPGGLWCGNQSANASRAKIIEQLRHMGGRHLVIARYSQNHNPNYEWVYNDADIDQSSIIWAQDMGARNRELIEYYPDRRLWVLDVDSPSLPLTVYHSPAAAPTSAATASK